MIEIPRASFVQIENRCYACGQPGHKSTKFAHKFKIPKYQLTIILAGTRAKSKIMAGHQAQKHVKVVVPGSDGTTLTTVITQPVQCCHPNYSNTSKQCNRWMNEHTG